MDWLANNWLFLMDWLAEEPVTNWLSLGAGWAAFCVTIVTLGLPAMVLVRLFIPARTAAIALIVLAGVVAFVAATFQVHEWLNIYQAWYTTPLGPSL